MKRGGSYDVSDQALAVWNSRRSNLVSVPLKKTPLHRGVKSHAEETVGMAGRHSLNH